MWTFIWVEHCWTVFWRSENGHSFNGMECDMIWRMAMILMLDGLSVDASRRMNTTYMMSELSFPIWDACIRMLWCNSCEKIMLIWRLDEEILTLFSHCVVIWRWSGIALGWILAGKSGFAVSHRKTVRWTVHSCTTGFISLRVLRAAGVVSTDQEGRAGDTR